MHWKTLVLFRGSRWSQKCLIYISLTSFCTCFLLSALKNILKAPKSTVNVLLWNSPNVGTKQGNMPFPGTQITYISEVQCSSACEKEAERTGHLALADRLAWQTSINTTWGSHSHCNEKNKVMEHKAPHSRKKSGTSDTGSTGPSLDR